MSSLQGKVVVITGAGGGMGREMARKFTELGSRLSLCDIDEENLQQTVTECNQISADCEVFSRKTDVGDTSQLKALASETVEEYGRVDVLINNAGIGMIRTISQTTEEEYQKIMDVNLKAAFFLTKELLPELVKTKGAVISTSSTASVAGAHQLIAYSMSKAALIMFTQCVAKEYASFGVRVNSISPGTTDTPMIGPKETPSYFRTNAEILQPLGGLVQPEDIARWAVFLASSDSGPITGQNIAVDGGYLVTRGTPIGYQLTKIQ